MIPQKDFDIKKGKLLLVALLFALSPILLLNAQNLSAGARVNPLATDLMNGMPNARPPRGIQGDIYLSTRWGLVSITLYEKK